MTPRVALLLAIAAIALVGTLFAPAGAHGVEPLGAEWHRAAILPAFERDAYAQPYTEESLAALRATGATHVGLYVEWYMANSTASSVSPDRGRTQTNSSIRHFMRQARSLGMTVSLTPVVRVSNGAWQGRIEPRRLGRWFGSYREMVARYARLAEGEDAKLFVVGAELDSISGHGRRWRNVIKDAREAFSGELTYSANWIGGARRFEPWRRLDYIGIAAYMTLVGSSDPTPSVSKLVRAWRKQGHVDAIAELRREHDKPVLFTEVGYASTKGNTAQPWAAGTGPISQEAQRRAYEAAYRVWSERDWFKGIYWWFWAYGGYHNPANGSHSPRGKLAEDTMRSWNTAR